MTDLAHLWATCPQITSVHASGDGQHAFWCWSGLTETDEVWTAPTDGTAPPERLTVGNDHFTIRDVSGDGRRLILAQSVHACEHDHLLLLDRDQGNALVQLTPTQDNHYLYGGTFSSDETAVIFIADFDYATGQTTPGGLIWSQDLTTGTRTCIARSDTPFETGPELDPTGKHLLWHRHERKPGGTQIWVLGADGTNPREILGFGDTENTHGTWIDADHIAFVTDHDGRDKLGIVTVSTGEIRWLAQEPELFPFYAIRGQGGAFAAIAHDQSNTIAVLADPEGNLRPCPNPTGRRTLHPHASLPDGSWLAEAYDSSGLHTLHRLHPDGRTTLIAAPTPELDRRFARAKGYRWTAPDGRPVQGWLYQPEGHSKGLVAYIHGGPTWHSEDWINPRIQFFVQSGYTVLDPNYRGSTGFGRDWREAVKDDGWGGREQADIRAGIEALIADGTATPGRIAVAGNSYGGFSSWFAITRHADLVNAAIPMCGMYRLDIDYNETEMPHGRAYSEEMMGGTPEQFPEKYANASPGNFVHQIRGAVMIVHGLADSNVGPENTHVAVRELTAAGIPHEVLLFENEGHGIARTSNHALYMSRAAAFLAQSFGAAK